VCGAAPPLALLTVWYEARDKKQLFRGILGLNLSRQSGHQGREILFYEVAFSITS
jgi:hypothetical protein